ncbi:MAG: hypothetical protein II807_03645 [Thermoguttaceae bacterium]|nr:hypothetical protein [Thermoguttaceae bacterium]
MKLYYYEGSTRKGPIPSVRLRELARKGEVAPETLIETVLGMRFRADEAGSYVSGLSLEKEFANLRAVPPEPSQERENKPEIKPKAGAAVVPAPELEAEFGAGPAEPKAEPAPAVESQPASVSAEPEPRKTVSGSSVSAAKRPLEDKAPPKDAPEDAIEWKELELIDVGGGTPQAEPTLDPFEALTNGLNAAPRYERPAEPPRRAANSAPRQTVLTANRKEPEPEPPAPAKSKGSRLNAVIFAAALIALIAMSFDISFSAILFFFACCIPFILIVLFIVKLIKNDGNDWQSNGSAAGNESESADAPPESPLLRLYGGPVIFYVIATVAIAAYAVSDGIPIGAVLVGLALILLFAFSSGKKKKDGKP